jgi:hypothetical protein
MDQSETMIPQDAPVETIVPKPFWKKWGIWIIAIIVLIAIIGALVWFNILPVNLGGLPKYQAVFLANGQVYFGKIAGEKEDYMKLASIYYLQVQQAVQPAATTKDDKGNLIQQPQPAPQQNIQLVKLGSELHGPEDMMYIAKNQILFYENLKADSRVVQAIKAFEKK